MRLITPETSNKFNCLVIGKPGMGKTSLLRTIPPGDRVCTLSAESGLLSVKDMVDAGKVQGVVVESFTDFVGCYENLARNPEWQVYDWIFIDSLTEIATMCATQAQEKYPEKKDSYNLWGEYADDMFKVIRGFRDLNGPNVVFTALETVELDDFKRRLIAPDMPGKKLKERLPAMFDEVFYMTMIIDAQGVATRTLCTSPISGYPAKDRSGRLAIMENPNLAEIEAKILGA